MQRIVAGNGPLLALGIVNRLDLLVNLYIGVCVSTGVGGSLREGVTKV